MSFFNQQGLYAMVYTNSLEAARSSKIYAVVRLCFGNEEDSIVVAYTKLGEDSMGYEIPNAPVMVRGKLEKFPFFNGKPWQEAVRMARLAMERVKKEHSKLPPNSIFKVWKNEAGKTVVEQEQLEAVAA